MNTIKWFDRKFVFDHTAGELPAILVRMEAAPQILTEVLRAIPADVLNEKPKGKWSVKEHVGHLSVLEPLWRTRISDIKAGKPELTPTDLYNNATSLAGFNDYDIWYLLEKFTQERNDTLALLSQIDPVSIASKSLHPRMQQHLGLADHLYFVAEHDDHHINYIRSLFDAIRL